MLILLHKWSHKRFSKIWCVVCHPNVEMRLCDHLWTFWRGFGTGKGEVPLRMNMESSNWLKSFIKRHPYLCLIEAIKGGVVIGLLIGWYFWY